MKQTNQHECPYCHHEMRTSVSIASGAPVTYPAPCNLLCGKCGYQENAAPLERQDLKALITEAFRERRDHCDSLPGSKSHQ